MKQQYSPNNILSRAKHQDIFSTHFRRHYRRKQNCTQAVFTAGEKSLPKFIK